MNPAATIAPRTLLRALVTRALGEGGFHLAASLLLSPLSALAPEDEVWVSSAADFDAKAPHPTPVVLVHGFLGNPGHFRFLRRFLVARGFHNFATFSYAPRVDHQELARRLGRAIEAVCEAAARRAWAAATWVSSTTRPCSGRWPRSSASRPRRHGKRPERSGLRSEAARPSVHLFRGRHRPEDRRAVVMDQQPTPVATLEEVRRLHVRLDLVVAVAAADVLGEDDPGEVAAHLRLHPRQREAHLERAREDALPALHPGWGLLVGWGPQPGW